MKRQKYKHYKKHKQLIKDCIAQTLQRSSERARQELKQRGAYRLITDLIRAEQELGE